MNKSIGTIAITGAFLFGGLLGSHIGQDSRQPEVDRFREEVIVVQSELLALKNGVFLQVNFPCQEDEALIFIDTPGKDETGCVNLEDLLSYRSNE